MFFLRASLEGRRFHRFHEGVKVDPIGDSSGSRVKHIHQVFELDTLVVHDSEVLQFLLVHSFAMVSDEQEGDVGSGPHATSQTTAPEIDTLMETGLALVFPLKRKG